MKQNNRLFILKKIGIALLLLVLCFMVVSCSEDKEEKIDKQESGDIEYRTIFVNINEDGEFSTTYAYLVQDGEKLEEPEIPRRDHYECVGFYNGETLWDFENDTVTGDVNLVAKWVETVTDYEVAYEAISKIDVTNYETIKEAREKYEAVSYQNKKYVDNYRSLYKAEIEYFNTQLANADTFEKIDALFALIEEYPVETVLKMGDAIKSIYNKRFELTYQEKISEVDNHQQEVVKAVANAFLYKKVYNQYDQTRRVAGASPYDASIYDTLYLDCSSYCYSIYTYCFGSTHHVQLNTASNDTYAKNHQTSEEIVYYVDTTKYTTEESQKALLKEIYDNLQVGDLINYRHGKTSGSSGHVVMYIGNGTIIHSTGDDMSVGNADDFKEMQTETEAAIGTVFTFDASQLFFDTTSYRYLFKKNSSDTVWSFSVIRPLANTMEVTDKALSNYLLSGVDITKTSNVGARTSVEQGEEITYTITFTNHSTEAIQNIPIYKEVPKYFDYVSSSDDGLYIDDLGIVFSINLEAGETKNVKYTLKVKENQSGNINDGSTYIHNITLPKISNTVVTGFNEEAFINHALELMDCKTYTFTYDFINDCYQAVRETGISDLFDSTSKETVFLDNTAYKVADISKGTSVKRVLSRYFETGDVLCCYNKTTKVYTTYLYLRKDLMVTVKDGQFIKIESASSVQKILDTMYAMNKYQLSRPMMIIN